MNRKYYTSMVIAGATACLLTVAQTIEVAPLYKGSYKKVALVERKTVVITEPRVTKEYISTLELVKYERRPEVELEYLGEFRATAYCGCAQCCGVARDIPITASGEPAQEDYIAVDPSIIPLGTYLYIEGAGMDGYYYAMDTGSAIKGYIVDFYFGNEEDSHYLTEVFGVQHVDIYLVL